MANLSLCQQAYTHLIICALNYGDKFNKLKGPFRALPMLVHTIKSQFDDRQFVSFATISLHSSETIEPFGLLSHPLGTSFISSCDLNFGLLRSRVLTQRSDYNWLDYSSRFCANFLYLWPSRETDWSVVRIFRSTVEIFVEEGQVRHPVAFGIIIIWHYNR